MDNHDLVFRSNYTKAQLFAYHGLGGFPQDISFFCQSFALEKGKAEAPLLPGHRGGSLNLLNFSERNIERFCEEQKNQIERSSNPVVLLAFSMGCLSLCKILSKMENNSNIKGLILLAPPLQLNPQAEGLLWGLERSPLAQLFPLIPKGKAGVLDSKILKDRDEMLFYPSKTLKYFRELQKFTSENVHLLKSYPYRVYMGAKDETVSLNSLMYFSSRFCHVIPYAKHHLGYDHFKLRLWKSISNFLDTII